MLAQAGQELQRPRRDSIAPGGDIRAGRLVLGGVGPYPWRLDALGKLLAGKKLDSALAAEAAGAAVSGAMALRDNGYKVEMVRGAVEQVLTAFI